MNLKARRYESSSLNRILANKSHHVILSQASFQHDYSILTIEVSQGYNTPGYSDGCKFEMCLMKACICSIETIMRWSLVSIQQSLSNYTGIRIAQSTGYCITPLYFIQPGESLLLAGYDLTHTTIVVYKRHE